MDGKIKAIMDTVYDEIIQATTNIIRDCETFTIEILRLEDPSYEQIANQLETLSHILELIMEKYPDDAEGFHKTVKANEYIQTIIYIAKAIKINNEELLQEYVDQLKRSPLI